MCTPIAKVCGLKNKDLFYLKLIIRKLKELKAGKLLYDDKTKNILIETDDAVELLDGFDDLFIRYT